MVMGQREPCFRREQTGFDNTVCVLRGGVEGTKWLQMTFMKLIQYYKTYFRGRDRS